jgi:hypothetical protein
MCDVNRGARPICHASTLRRTMLFCKRFSDALLPIDHHFFTSRLPHTVISLSLPYGGALYGGASLGARRSAVAPARGIQSDVGRPPP